MVRNEAERNPRLKAPCNAQRVLVLQDWFNTEDCFNAAWKSGVESISVRVPGFHVNRWPWEYSNWQSVCRQDLLGAVLW
jgi:hypothetical protein